MLVDPDGQEAVTATLIVAGVGAGSVAVTGGVALIIGYIAWEVGNGVNNWIEKQQEEKFFRQAAEASRSRFTGSNLANWADIEDALSSKKKKKRISGGGSGGDGGDDEPPKKDTPPESNTAQNQQAEDARKEIARRLGRKLSREERDQVHRHITKQSYSYHEIIEEGIGLFSEY